jgi:RNA polymerase-binding transcription factor DksA
MVRSSLQLDVRGTNLLGQDDAMNATRNAQFEQTLLAERSRLKQMLDRLSLPPTDAAGEHGRFGDDVVASSGGASSEDDHALAVHTSHELADIERALDALREDPEHFGLCTTCSRPISLERMRLVPGTRHCRLHAPR